MSATSLAPGAQGGANIVSAWAPAKVNLYLHVGPPGPGGMHPVDSLVMFADVRAADRVSAKSHPQLSLNVDGPAAKPLKSSNSNLVMAAATALREACGMPGLGAQMTLHKVLPVAGGVGGGSSDAAAALHLLNAMWNVNMGEPGLESIGQQLGSDVPACVRGRPLLMRGMGERLTDVQTPDLPVVLLNPGVPLETRKVFQRYDETPGLRGFEEVSAPMGHDLRSFADALKGYRNDLEAPAKLLCKEINRALDYLAREPGLLLARMSGSGPTCFGIFESEQAAEAAAKSIAEKKRKYWARATTLRGAGRG